MAHSFVYQGHNWQGPMTCPRCKQELKKGDLVHWWNDSLWHRIKPFTEDECEVTA